MSSAWELPVTIEAGGKSFAVRSDFRAVLDALAAMGDPDLTQKEQIVAAVEILLPDWKTIPQELSGEVWDALVVFINCGEPVDKNQRPRPQLISWEQDVGIIAPEIDKVLGYSCRRCEYLHWWEFIGAFHCIGRGLFSEVVSVRSKRAKGKKLEKWEQEFARDNAKLIQIKAPESAEDREEKRRLLQILSK